MARDRPSPYGDRVAIYETPSIIYNITEENTTMEMTITLNNEQTQQLEKLAKHCSVHPQELVRAAINDFLSRPSEDFLRSAHYVVEKNEELYKRLS